MWLDQQFQTASSIWPLHPSYYSKKPLGLIKKPLGFINLSGPNATSCNSNESTASTFILKDLMVEMTTMSSTPSVASRSSPMSWVRALYDNIMKWAEHGHPTRALCTLSFIESIFFPIPVDPFLLAVGTAKPKKAILYGFLATVFSVLGGLVGYFIGYLFWDATQDLFFSYIISQDKFELVMAKFQANAFMAIFLAGLTPIPFKVFTIAGGVANLALLPFVLGSLAGRALRFLVIGILLYFLGASIRNLVEKYFERLTIASGIFVVAAFVIYKAVS